MKNKVLFYFLKELRTSTVKVPRGTDFDTIQAGTPLSEAGAIANDATAYGIVMHNRQKEWTREATINGYANVTVIVAGYIDEAEAEASCGLEYTDALKGALTDVIFGDGNVVFGDSGSAGFTPEGTIDITENGTVDVYNYASANVNVPTGITPTGTKSITENGTYDVTEFASANVNVSEHVTVGTVTFVFMPGGGTKKAYGVFNGSGKPTASSNLATSGGIAYLPVITVSGTSFLQSCIVLEETTSWSDDVTVTATSSDCTVNVITPPAGVGLGARRYFDISSRSQAKTAVTITLSY